MREIRSVAIVGIGAIGSIYAVKFHEYDPGCLRVIVDEGRRARYAADGIVFNGKRYDFNYVLPDSGAEKADLILIATKASGLDAAIESIEGYVGDDTIILSLLNGIESEDLIAETYGWDKVLYSLFIGHPSVRQGNSVCFDGEGTIMFGEADNTQPSARVARVQECFDRLGIAYEIPTDMLFALWRKLMINVGVNQASAVLNAPYGVLQTSEAALGIVRDLMGEVVALARAVGIENTDNMLSYGMEVLRGMPPHMKPSMLQDVEAGRVTEVDIFAGTVSELGRRYCVPTPLNDIFLRLIRAIDQKHATGF